MDIQEYQDKYEAFDNAIKAIKTDIKELVTSAEKDGLYFTNGKFKKSGTIIGCVLREAYYDKYVGERGAMYNGSQSAFDTKLTTEEFEEIYQAVVAIKQTPGTEEDYVKVVEMLQDYFPEHCFPPYPTDWTYRKDVPNKNADKFLEHAIKFFEDITAENNKISYRYSGDGDPGEPVDDSGFDLGYFEQKWISNFKSSSYENKFDVYSYRGQVKW
jgi:hypothetical protein